MSEYHEYRLHLRRLAGGSGELSSEDYDLPPLEVAPPPQFGGPAGVWSPEHLFVASVAACLMTTFQAVASMSQLDIVDYADDPTGRLVKSEDRRYRFDLVVLRPRVVVDSETKAERARRLLEKAKEACLVSRSVSARVVVEPTIEVISRQPPT
jgi:organic hydroperoxide reductase OsmC/OhrA